MKELTRAICLALKNDSVPSQNDNVFAVSKEMVKKFDDGSIKHYSPEPNTDWFLVDYNSYLYPLPYLIGRDKLKLKHVNKKYLLIEILDKEIYVEWELSDGVKESINSLPETLRKPARKAYVSAVEFICDELAFDLNISVYR